MRSDNSPPDPLGDVHSHRVAKLGVTSGVRLASGVPRVKALEFFTFDRHKPPDGDPAMDELRGSVRVCAERSGLLTRGADVADHVLLVANSVLFAGLKGEHRRSVVTYPSTTPNILSANTGSGAYFENWVSGSGSLDHEWRPPPRPIFRSIGSCRPERVRHKVLALIARWAAGALLPLAGHCSSNECSCSIAIIWPATALSAASKCAGNFFPRRSARRRIPRQHFGLKKYFCGASVSKMADNEQTAASLGHSVKLRVKHTPSDFVEWAGGESCVAPAVFRNCWNDSGKASKHDCKVSPSIAGENSGDVLEDNPARPKLRNNSMQLEIET